MSDRMNQIVEFSTVYVLMYHGWQNDQSTVICVFSDKTQATEVKDKLWKDKIEEISKIEPKDSLYLQWNINNNPYYVVDTHIRKTNA